MHTFDPVAFSLVLGQDDEYLEEDLEPSEDESPSPKPRSYRLTQMTKRVFIESSEEEDEIEEKELP